MPAASAQLAFHLEPRFFETTLFIVGLHPGHRAARGGRGVAAPAPLQDRERKLQARVDERTAELAMRLEQLETARERLAHAEKLAAMGTLAAGVGP